MFKVEICISLLVGVFMDSEVSISEERHVVVIELISVECGHL